MRVKLIKEVRTITYPFPIPAGEIVELMREIRPGVWEGWYHRSGENDLLIVLTRDKFEEIR